jgi:catechol 2,3-dioxygenase-like lactoylglutathione lyase family enzyme
MQAQRVDFIAVPTTDRERAADFYEHTLGLTRDGNGLPLHHRYAPYRDGTTP